MAGFIGAGPSAEPGLAVAFQLHVLNSCRRASLGDRPCSAGFYDEKPSGTATPTCGWCARPTERARGLPYARDGSVARRRRAGRPRISRFPIVRMVRESAQASQTSLIELCGVRRWSRKKPNGQFDLSAWRCAAGRRSAYAERCSGSERRRDHARKATVERASDLGTVAGQAAAEQRSGACRDNDPLAEVVEPSCKDDDGVPVALLLMPQVCAPGRNRWTAPLTRRVPHELPQPPRRGPRGPVQAARRSSSACRRRSSQSSARNAAVITSSAEVPDSARGQSLAACVRLLTRIVVLSVTTRVYNLSTEVVERPTEFDTGGSLGPDGVDPGPEVAIGRVSAQNVLDGMSMG